MVNNQVQTLLHHLLSVDSVSRKRRTISAMEAIGLYRIHSLSRRICDLTNSYPTLGIFKVRKVDTTGRAYVRYGIV